MTVRKKNKETGEITEQTVPLKDLFLGTPTFRTIIILLLLSMHPIGRQLLGTFGFEFPDQKKLTVAAEEATASKHELTAIAEDVKEMKADVAALKANNTIVNEKVDTLRSEFSGFKIDFSKWKPQTPPQL